MQMQGASSPEAPFFLNQGFNNMSGILWAFASGAGFGFFQALNRKSQKGMDVYRGTFLLLVISSALLIVISLLTEDVSLLWSAPLKAILIFALAGFLHFFMGWTFISLSQAQVGAARTGAIVGTTPLFAAALAVVTLGEVLSLKASVGVVLIVAGAYLVTRR
jgi:drug/metabolite transporter (DMT)-like permease